MDLSQLIADLPIGRAAGAGNPAVTGLTDDSRRVTPGVLFVCRGPLDGRAAGYVRSAVERGAAAVLTEPADDGAGLALPGGVVHLVARPGVPVDQRLAGRIAEQFFGRPASKLTLIGITGTNGKTTTATITQHLLRAAGRRPGLLGTVHLDTGHPDGPRPAELTTPGAIDLSRLLAEMVENGCDSAVMEVSSHALHQGRADHLRFAAAAFTNLTQDHLDYHGSMAEYADAKAMLFEALNEDATAVLNGDDAAASRMARGCKADLLTTHVTHDPRSRDDSRSAVNQPVYVVATELAASHSRARFIGPWGDLEATLPLVGPHNLANAVQAAALAHAVTGIDAETLRTALDACPPVPGRLEPVGPDWPARPATPEAHGLDASGREHQRRGIDPSETAKPSAATRPGKRGGERDLAPTVLVDYAHTPDALINVASALRRLTPPPGRLVVLFGCGGDRDRAKRPLMMRAARGFADIVVLTSDNPRTEDPERILRDAEQGLGGGGRHPEHHTITDRAEAIRFAIGLARPGDTVLIAGKGHEDYQVIGHEKHHFDDREHAAAALRDRVQPPIAPSPRKPTPSPRL